MKTALPLPASRTARPSDSHAALPAYRPARSAAARDTGRTTNPSFLKALLRSLSGWSA